MDIYLYRNMEGLYHDFFLSSGSMNKNLKYTDITLLFVLYKSGLLQRQTIVSIE